MSLTDMSHQELQTIIDHLDQALYNHKEWHRLLIRALVCQLEPNAHDLASEAHKECRFGQWYYNHQDGGIVEHPRFIAIGDEHIRLHKLAASLITASMTKSSVSTYDYDNFSNSLERLQLEIFSLKHELEELIYQRDPLTKATSRLYMLPILHEQVELLRRHVYQSSYIIMMDLDHFSDINNNYGHVAGDKVLAGITSFVIKNLRAYDKVFRYGGEEFLLLIQNIELKSAYDMVARLCKGMAELTIDIGEGKQVGVTGSFGLTPLDPQVTIEESIDRADKALYTAKASGRNRVVVWADKKRE